MYDYPSPEFVQWRMSTFERDFFDKIRQDVIDRSMIWSDLRKFDHCHLFYFTELVEYLDESHDFDFDDIYFDAGTLWDLDVFDRMITHTRVESFKMVREARSDAFYVCGPSDIIAFTQGNPFDPLIVKLALGMNVTSFPFDLAAEIETEY